LIGFLYGWSFFAVIQTGTIAAVGVAFGKFAAYLVPSLGDQNILYEIGAFKLKAAQLVSIATIILLTFSFGPYFLIMFGNFTPWQMFGLICLSGFSLAGVGFSVSHDALHGAYSKNTKINKLLGLTFPLIGVSDYLWKIKHNVMHHTFTNIYEKDEDLSVTKFLRMTPVAPHKPIHRIQHVLAFFAYSLLSVGWVFLFDFKKIFSHISSKGSPYSGLPKAELLKIAAFKIFYLIYALALPLIFLPLAWWQVLGGFIAMHLITGFTITIIFQLAHIVEGLEYPEPEEGAIDNAWVVHQMETTANFAVNNKFITWFVGGLNFQVEHHLFPKICSIHYSAISKIVAKTAEEHGIRYHTEHSFWGAIASHYRILRKYSKPNAQMIDTEKDLAEQLQMA
ncbi:MAG: acyl-CoA desaturase, partial [Sphingobacteriales bacterium]